jgi:opacity protein-like surface antigen
VLKVTLSTLLVVLLSGSVVAQDEKPTEVYLTTGAAFPTRDFNVKYNLGYNGSVGVGFRIANNLRLVTKAEVQTFAFDQSLYVDSVNGGKFTALMTGIDLRVFKNVPNWGLDPILLVGAGVAYAAVSALTVGSESYDSRNETKFFVNVGAGVDIRLSPKLSGFVTARYVRISTGGTRSEFFPVNIGIRF